MSDLWLNSVVLIASSDPSESHFGTGFVIAKVEQTTYLLTCTHVVQDVGGTEKMEILGTQARVIASSPEEGADLAVLCMERRLDNPPLPLYPAGEKGKSFNTAGFQLDGKRFAIRKLHGNLGGQVGIQMKGQADRLRAWDLEITDKYLLQPGYSGSPVVDKYGNVMGVVNTKRGEGKTGVAISIEALKKVWSEMPPGLLEKDIIPNPPTGTVTFLFTDIEDSTMRWEHHPEAMPSVLARYDDLLRSIITTHGGFVFELIDDAVYAAFATAVDAVAAAVAAQRAVAAEEWGKVGPLRVRMALHTGAAQSRKVGPLRVRMALHTGAAQSRDADYVGPTLNRVVGLLAAGYGGQVLLSMATKELARDALPAGVSLEDLGEHALKDLLRPEHVFQLVIPDLPSDFSPLRTLSRRRHNLPIQPTPLIGREQEMANVRRLLSRPEVRLVTLTGTGGIGKTRLALQVAAELADHFADGVFLVNLASVMDPEQVLPAIAQTLNIGEGSDLPLLALLQTALKEKQLVLLLDNFEQVEAASLWVAELLAACPRLKLLVTSRSVLHVRAEQEFEVHPLSQDEAVALFIGRAQAVKPAFQVTNDNAHTVAAICALLDGLPLAIELAAARVKHFLLPTLLARLEQGLSVLEGDVRDLPDRHRTLRETIAWSYNLLSSEEQQLFRHLAVFVDGWDLEAAKALSMARGGRATDIQKEMASLVDKSLLRQEEQATGEMRFSMLQTLRKFGLEQLAGSRELEATCQAHADYYLALAEKAEPHLRRTERKQWSTRLKQEQENLHAALTWLLEQARIGGEEVGIAQAERALRLCGALYWFWYTHAYVRESQGLLQQALAVRAGVAAAVQARALYVAGELAFFLDHYDQAAALSQESLALYRELTDTRGIAGSLSLLGFISGWAQSQFARARGQYEEASALFQQVGDTWEVLRCRTQIARLYTVQGEYERARALLEESLGHYRALGDQERFGWTLYLLARVLFLSRQDLTRASALFEQSLELSSSLGSTSHVALLLDLLGQIRLVQGQPQRARELAEESVAMLQELGNRGDTVEALIDLGRVVARSGDLALARHRYEEGLALLRELNLELGFLEHVPACLEGVAAVEAAQGEPGRAAQLWGTAEALREAMGTPLHSVERADYEQAVAAARRELGEEAFGAAWAQGRATPREQVITEVLKT